MLYRLQKVVRHIAQTEVMPRFLNTPSRRKEDGSVLSEQIGCTNRFCRRLPLLEDCPMLGEEMSVQEQTRLWNEHSDGKSGLCSQICFTQNRTVFLAS